MQYVNYINLSENKFVLLLLYINANVLGKQNQQIPNE